jgi:hypothetical protein
MLEGPALNQPKRGAILSEAFYDQHNLRKLLKHESLTLTSRVNILRHQQKAN